MTLRRIPKEDLVALPASEEAQGPKTSNPLKGAGARATGLVGDLLEGVGRTFSLAEDYNTKNPAITSLLATELGKKAVSKLPLQDWANSLRKYSQDIGYAPTDKVSDVIRDPTKIGRFAVERFVSSVPDMAGMIAAPVPYLAARTNEILNESLKNDKRELKDATWGDVAKAFGIATSVGLIERYATQRLVSMPGVTPGTTGLGRVSTEGAIQGATESIQNLIEYAGTRGKLAPFSHTEAQENIFEGMFAGKPVGVAGQASKELGYALTTPSSEPLDKTPITEPLRQVPKENLVPIPPVEAQPVTTPTEAPTASVVPEVQELVNQFGLTEQEAQEMLTAEQQPVPISSEFVTQFPEVQKAIADADSAIIEYGTFAEGTDTKEAIKRQYVQSALIDLGVPITAARDLVTELERNNYGNSGTAIDERGIEPSIPLPSEQPRGTGQFETPEQRGLGRDIGLPAVLGGRETQQYGALDQNAESVQPTPEPFDVSQTQTAGQSIPNFERRPEEILSPTEIPVEIQSTPVVDPTAPIELDLGRQNPQNIPESPETTLEAPTVDSIDLGRVAPTPVQDIPPPIDLGRVQKIETPSTALKVAKKPSKTIQQLKRERQEAKERVKDQKAKTKSLGMIDKFLSKTLDAEAFPSPESAYFAGKSLLAHKNNFLDLVNSWAQSSKYKGTYVQRKAKRIINRLSETDKAKVKARAKDFEAAKWQVSDEDLAQLTSSVTSKPNNKYSGFKTAQAAANWLTRNGTSFEKELSVKLLPHLNGVKLKVVDDIAKVASSPLAIKDAVISAMYKRANKTIYLHSDLGINNGSFLHEALHAATIDKINSYNSDSPRELKQAVDGLTTLMQDAKTAFEALSDSDRKDYGFTKEAEGQAFSNIKEFIAYGLTSPAMQEMLKDTPSKQGSKLSRLFNQFVQLLRKLLGLSNRNVSAFYDLVDITDQILEAEISPLESDSTIETLSQLNRDIKKDLDKIKYSKDSSEILKTINASAKNNHNFTAYKNALNARYGSISEQALPVLLNNMPSFDLIRWKGDDIAPLARIDDAARKLSGMRIRLHSKANELTTELQRFIRKNGNSTISDVAHIARLQEISFYKNPTLNDALQNDWRLNELRITGTPLEVRDREKVLREAYKMWGDLNKQQGGQRMYRKLQAYYMSYMRSRRHYLNNKINALNIAPGTKTHLISAIHLMYTTAAKNSGDYTPFTRHGDYWLRIKRGDGKGFYKFDSPRERNAFLTDYASNKSLNKEDSTLFEVGSDDTAIFDMVQQNSKMLKTMFELVDKGNIGQSAQLKDDIYQAYLQTMPEASMRKHFVHADKVTGFNTDMLRNFKTYAMKAGNDLAKLANYDKIENEISAGYAALSGMPTTEKNKARKFVDVLANRAREELNPPPENKVANLLNQFTFLWLLTSASSAALQMVSVPVMVLPSLMAKHGWGAASRKFAAYSNVLNSMGAGVSTKNGVKEIIWPSLLKSDLVKNNPLLARALKEATDEYNLFQSTNISVLTDRRKTPETVSDSMLSNAATRTYNIMTAMFNGSERVARELSFGMAFELEYAKSKDYEKAKAYALDTVDELLGRYDTLNKPQVLRGPIMKNIGQFKQYAIVMTSFWVRNMNNVLRGETPEVRRYALERMVGTSLMGALIHGMYGMPLYGITALTLDALLNIDSDDKEERKRRNPFTAESSDLRFRFEFLPELVGGVKVPGIDGRQHELSDVLLYGPSSVLSDMNIGAKTSHDILGLWFRESKPGANYIETVQNMIFANLGPSVSTGVNIVGGAQDFMDGDPVRGMEKLAPAFFRGFPTAYRLSTEGAETKGGLDILSKDEINTLNMIGSITGLQPTRLAQLQNRNFKIREQIIHAEQERTQLLQKHNKALYDDKINPEKLKSIYEDIDKFNKRWPTERLFISVDTVIKSSESYAEKLGTAYRGLHIDDKTMPYLYKILRNTEPNR